MERQEAALTSGQFIDAEFEAGGEGEGEGTNLVSSLSALDDQRF
jgi:hypothetical protein